MTRLAVLADIHGNLPALEAVWDDLSQFDVDHVVVAGDVVNVGPFSRQVLEYLTARHCAIIRGNHEYYLLDYDTPRVLDAWADFTLPGWVHRQIGDGWRNRIAAWPDEISLRFPDAPPVRVVHASPGDPWKGIFRTSSDNEISEMLAKVTESTVITAHTHLMLDRVVDRWHIVNPGSVGNPFYGASHANYMLLESDGDGWHKTFRSVPFDSERVIREFERQHFVEEHGIFGRLVMDELRTARQHVSPFLRWYQSCHPDESQTLELLEGFTDEVRWEYTLPVYHVNRETPAFTSIAGSAVDGNPAHDEDDA